MPDGQDFAGGQIPFSEFQKFRDWLTKQYGVLKAITYPTPITRVTNDPIYQYWVSIGKPAPTQALQEEESLPTLENPSLRGERETDIGEIEAWGVSPEEAERLAATKPGAGYTVGNIERSPEGGFRVAWTPPTTPPQQGFLGEAEQLDLRRAQLQNALLEQQLGGAGGQRRGGLDPIQARALQRQITQRERGAGDVSNRALADALQGELGRFDSPRDWIKRWDAQQRISQLRTERDPVTAAERIRGFEENVRSTQVPAQRAAERFPSLTEVEATEGSPVLLQAQADIAVADSALRQLGRAKAGEIGAKEGRSFDIKPPPTPEWLARLAPNRLTTGEPLKRIRPFALSGQQFRQLTPSQRSGWAGYIDWLGGEPEAILEQMALTAPKTPDVPRQFAPARQGR